MQDEKNRTATATGNVAILYRDLEIHSDRLEMDEDREEARMTGNVRIVAKNQVFTGEEITVNLKDSRWEFHKGRGEISPRYFEPGTVLEPIYVRGEKVAGSENRVEASSGLVTTCDLADPHYSIRARKITVIPDDKIIVRNAGFYLGEKRVFSVHTFSVSLKPFARRRIPILPYWGVNDAEGYFLKTTYQYMATEKQLGTLYMDFMQKRGIGTGVQQDYTLDSGGGSAYVYHLQDRDTGNTELDARLQHRQELPFDVLADFSLNASRNDLYSQNSNMLNTDLSLRRNVDGTNVQLGLHERRSNSDYSDSASRNVNFRVTHQATPDTTVTLSEDYRYFDFISGSAADQELDSRLEVKNRGKWLDWTFRMEQREDLDGADYSGDDLSYYLNRVPEVELQTDSLRTKHEVFGMFPAGLKLGFGQFKEFPEHTSLYRANLDLKLDNYMKTYGDDTSLTLSGAFQQSFYSDNSAQYVVNYRSELKRQLDRHWSGTVTYSRQAPSGFTPFRFDYSRAFDSVDSVLQYNLGDRMRINFSAGLDLSQDIYRDAILRYQFIPNETYYFSLSTGYDINNSEFRDVLTRFKLFHKDRLNFNVTTRYNPVTDDLSRVNAYLDWRVGERWGIQALSGYNGFTRDFDYNQVKVRRTFHDWHAFLTYDDQRREMRFDLALKAFPFFDTRFGVGESGELLDTSGGEIY